MQEMLETPVQSLGREDVQEEERAAQSSSRLENPEDRGAWWATVPGVELDTTEHSTVTINVMTG